VSETYQRLSAKLLLRSSPYWRTGPVFITHEHWCPACKSLHSFAVNEPFPSNGAHWSFDGNVDAPTFQPSMNIRIGPFPAHGDKPERMSVCHYFLHAGRILYLGDCTHELVGQTVDLPDIPPEATKWMVAQS
jgi:hypothetical protein